MALPTRTNLQNQDFSLDGAPFIPAPANDSIIMGTQDFSLDGAPFVVTFSSVATATTRFVYSIWG